MARTTVNKLFDLHISPQTPNSFKADAARTYQCTYDDLLKRLCKGRLLHADETRVSVMGKDCYVWVLTTGRGRLFLYANPGRQHNSDIAQRFLWGPSGISTRYMTNRLFQQKCLIHFIRDLNDYLLKHPYDEGLKRLVGDFAGWVKPMLETVDRHGLKKRFLRKHRLPVKRFYKRIAGGL